MINGVCSNYSSRSALTSLSVVSLKFCADRHDTPSSETKPTSTKQNDYPPQATLKPPKRAHWLKRMLLPVFLLGGLGVGAGGITHIVHSVKQVEKTHLLVQKQQKNDEQPVHVRSNESKIRQQVLSMTDNMGKAKVLMSYLKDSNPKDRVMIAENTRLLSGDLATKYKMLVLNDLIDDASPEVRAAVAKATKHIENYYGKMQIFRTLVKDSSASVRGLVAELALDIEDDQLKAEIIRPLINDRDTETRWAAITLLESMKSDDQKATIFWSSLSKLNK